jgi:hypothetical protein
MIFTRLCLVMVLVCAVLCLPLTATAQDAPAWDVVLLRSLDSGRALVTITPDGMSDAVPLPDGFPTTNSIRLSPDRIKIAALDSSESTIVIADLAAGTCCTEIPFLDTNPTSTSLAGFSPDGTRIAVAYMLANPFQSAILVYDVNTLEQPAHLDTTPTADDGLLKTYPELDSWREDGIYFLNQCTECVDYGGGALDIWNPDTGNVTSSGEPVDYRADVLPLRHEQLSPIFAADYPAVPNTDAMVFGPELYGIRNAVQLSGARAEDNRAVVYYDPDNLTINSVRWVADGSAFIVFGVSGQGANVLVTPDAAPQPINFGDANFVAGTPDGWLTVEDDALWHYTLDGGTIEREDMGAFNGRVTILAATPLGATAYDRFPTVPPPEPVTCDGFMESRLVPGHIARVLPGAANNVRNQPSTQGEIVAKIAGGAQFMVLEGPTCAQGLAWWRVAYLSFEGWTAEGTGNAYWVEPVE